MIRTLLISFCLTALSFSGFAQRPSSSNGNGDVLYKKQLIGGLTIHSEGWGGIFKLGQHITAKKYREWSFQAVSMRHPKEFKTFNPYYDDSKGYVYGKQNSFFVIRPAWGQRQILFDKERARGVEVGFSYAVGPSLGFIKPVYLEIGHPTVPYKYITVEKYDPAEHFTDNIFGRASATRGLDELKIAAGIHSRFGLHFEYSGERDGIKALEAGVAVDAYPQRIPIMAIVQNKQIFLSFYLNLMIGKKYFR